MSTRKSIQATGAPAERTTAERPAQRARAGVGRGQRVLAPAAPRRPRTGAYLQPLAPTAAPHPPRRQRFGELRAALAEGWEIVQPIFARPLWSAPDDSKTAFNFVLANAQGTRLVTVPQGRMVERFIATRRLAVDYPR